MIRAVRRTFRARSGRACRTWVTASTRLVDVAAANSRLAISRAFSTTEYPRPRTCLLYTSDAADDM
eukprot:2007797-Alexandrium_andersonii.AAC.1